MKSIEILIRLFLDLDMKDREIVVRDMIDIYGLHETLEKLRVDKPEFEDLLDKTFIEYICENGCLNREDCCEYYDVHDEEQVALIDLTVDENEEYIEESEVVTEDINSIAFHPSVGRFTEDDYKQDILVMNMSRHLNEDLASKYVDKRDFYKDTYGKDWDLELHNELYALSTEMVRDEDGVLRHVYMESFEDSDFDKYDLLLDDSNILERTTILDKYNIKYKDRYKYDVYNGMLLKIPDNKLMKLSERIERVNALKYTPYMMFEATKYDI